MKWAWIACVCLCALLGAGLFPAMALDDGECRGCHTDSDVVGCRLTINASRFDGTPHADSGCVSCHADVSDSHPDDGQKLGRASCGDCHTEVVAEYSETGHAGNAACVDCHNPHAVRALNEVSGYDMNRPCAVCHEHEVMVTQHSQWLPQTNTHLASLPCITCHTGSEKMVLELYLSRRDVKTVEGDFQLATYEELMTLNKGEDPFKLIDRNGNRIVSLEELRAFNRNPEFRDYRLQGLMLPARQTHSYDILYNRWDCTYCHGTGPASLQTSYLGFPEQDGSFRRVPVEKGAVLTVLYSTPDFYMVGATRNAALNLVGALIMAGGLVMPVGHGFLRFLTRKNRK